MRNIKPPYLMNEEDFLYSRIGMALISTQRVEFLTGKILELLIKFDKKVYNITTEEFFLKSSKSKSAYKTLGAIFNLLKLNPELVIENELNDYLKKRNLFVHNFWSGFLNEKTEEKTQIAIDFCYDFGRHSDKISSFFQGFLYFMALRHVKNVEDLDSEFRKWDSDYTFFIHSLQQKKLNID